MNNKQYLSRISVLLMLMIASVVLAISCYMIGLHMDEPNVPTSGVIENLGNTDSASTSHSTSSFVQNTTNPITTTTTTTSAATTTKPTTTATTIVRPGQDMMSAPEEPFYDRVECGGRLKIIADSANVRSDADKNAQLVAVVYKGESYDVVSQKCSSTGVLWFEIKVNGTTGYIAGTYVDYDGTIPEGKVYLTFDDGPSKNTWRILDTLDKYGVKATFFVIFHGNQDDAYKAIVERGHAIALHSYSHSYSEIYTSAQAYFNDLKRLDDHVHALTGVHSSIIRFPGGTSNTISEKYCKGVMSDIVSECPKRGYYFFDWNVDSCDASANSVPAKDIVNNIKHGMRNRRDAVILMHDASAKSTTADALPEIIEYLQAKGYEILPLTETTPPVHHKAYN